MNQPARFLELNPELSLSAGHDRTIVFARHKSGALAHIDWVENGKACECCCLACDENLIARQGEIRGHSFAHQSGTECEHAHEAMLHGLAAELIGRRGYFVTPPLRVEASAVGPHGPIKEAADLAAAQVPLDGVGLARRAPWRRPCIVALVKGRELLVHLALYRQARDAERAVLAEHNQAAVQIDLAQPGLRTLAELEHVLFGADDRKRWLFNPRQRILRAELADRLKAQADRQWEAHRQALVLQAKQNETIERRRAARALQQAAELAADRALQFQQQAAAEVAEARPVCAPVRHQRPEEGSPSVEYSCAEGSVWLLHSTRPGIHFKVDDGVQHALQVLRHHGAVEDATAGRYVISTEGWAAASVRLGSTWRGVRSVGGPPATQPEDLS